MTVKYQLIKNPIYDEISCINKIVDDKIVCVIPYGVDGNIDYAEYKRWIAMGNEPILAN